MAPETARKVKSSWLLMKQEMMGWQWHQLGHMQIICTSLQTDKRASTSSFNFFLYFYGPDALPDAKRRPAVLVQQKFDSLCVYFLGDRL